MTYSIVARDPKTGEIGVAVQSHYFSVGSSVTWARSGVGAVATQSMVEVSYGPLGLDLMAGGKSAEEALNALLKADPRSETRQVAMIDSKGRVAVHTGRKCIPYAGHITGEQYCCEANLMSNDRIWGEMEKSYKKNSDLLLPERLLAALEAAEEEGGDIRGKQSAAILVVSPDLYPNYWQGRVVELRVEDNPEPLLELKRLLRLKRAYEWAEKGYDLLGLDRFNESQDAFQKAWNYAPEIEELRYLQGISLLESGRANEAAPILRPIFKKDRRWIQVTKSLKEIGMINSDEATLNSLFS